MNRWRRRIGDRHRGGETIRGSTWVGCRLTVKGGKTGAARPASARAGRREGDTDGGREPERAAGHEIHDERCHGREHTSDVVQVAFVTGKRNRTQESCQRPGRKVRPQPGAHPAREPHLARLAIRLKADLRAHRRGHPPRLLKLRRGGLSVGAREQERQRALPLAVQSPPISVPQPACHHRLGLLTPRLGPVLRSASPTRTRANTEHHLPEPDAVSRPRAITTQARIASRSVSSTRNFAGPLLVARSRRSSETVYSMLHFAQV